MGQLPDAAFNVGGIRQLTDGDHIPVVRSYRTVGFPYVFTGGTLRRVLL